jgi:hypothetical protein
MLLGSQVPKVLSRGQGKVGSLLRAVRHVGLRQGVGSLAIRPTGPRFTSQTYDPEEGGDVRRVLTTGHCTHPIDELLQPLIAPGVAPKASSRVVDWPAIAKSRHDRQLDEDESESLPANGIGYGLLEDLAVCAPWRTRRTARAGRVAFRIRGLQSQTPVFTTGLDRLIDLRARPSMAIMCAQAVPWHSHRSALPSITEWL